MNRFGRIGWLFAPWRLHNKEEGLAKGGPSLDLACSAQLFGGKFSRCVLRFTLTILLASACKHIGVLICICTVHTPLQPCKTTCTCVTGRDMIYLRIVYCSCKPSLSCQRGLSTRITVSIGGRAITVWPTVDTHTLSLSHTHTR